MSNIPAGDPGLVLVPGVETFCEWLVRLAGGIATCVEVSEMVVDHVATQGRIPVSAAEDVTLADDLIARGQASANGATNYQAASEQMTRLGVPNVAYGPAQMQGAGAVDWQGLAHAALDRGEAVLFGVYAAHNLVDDWTGRATDGGVDGHGIALVGYDTRGFVVADPNTAQAKDGNFVHYSAATLERAFGPYPSMVIPEGSLMLDITAVSGFFEAQADGSWRCKQTGHTIHMGQLTYFRSLPFAETGLPLTDEFFPQKGVGAQVFERGIHVYDPSRAFDSPPGAVGPCYKGHLDDARLNSALTAATVAQSKAALAAAQNQVTDLQNKLGTIKSGLLAAQSAVAAAVKEAA